MENKKYQIVWWIMSVIGVLLAASCLCGLIYGMIVVPDVTFKINNGVEFLCLVFAGLYLLRGFKKDAAKYYKMFMLFLAISYIVEYLVFGLKVGVESDLGKDSLAAAMSMIAFGSVLTLGVGKDLGKVISYSMCGVLLFLSILTMVLGLSIGDFASEPERIAHILEYLTWFCLAGLVLVMTFAKYQDKKIRGTK